MDHIEQLKKIRAEAIARIRNSDDFKLAGKLGLLIVELGSTVDDIVDYELGAVPAASVAEKTARPFETPAKASEIEDDAGLDDLTNDQMIEELVAEIEGDAAEIDALLAKEKSDMVGPFLKPTKSETSYTNGASH